jgi:hypothetical protein
MDVEIDLEYCCVATVPVDLPEGKTLEDVDSYQVKWSMLWVRFKDGTEFETSVDVNDPEIDWSRPVNSNLREAE